MSHSHHHSKHHHQHSEDTTYHLDGEKLSVHFLDDWSPDISGTIEVSHFHHGHGGQNVNKSNRGVRISFEPEDGGEKILASCNDERSEIQNRERALKSLIDKIRDEYKKDAPRIGTKVPGWSKHERIEEKKHRGTLKKERQEVQY